MDESLDHLVRVQDALDAMDDTSCLTRADFVDVNKPAVRHLYAAAWDDARQLVRDFRNLRNAAQHIEKRIQAVGAAELPNKAPIDLTPEEREQVGKVLTEVHEKAKRSMREQEDRIAEYKRMGKLR